VGTIVVGVLDGLDAIVVFGLRSGVTPERIFQGIAAGVLGPASFAGGWRTAALGVALHFLVAGGIVATFLVASRIAPPLRRRPFMFGPLYGVVVYFVMNLVVIPLSALGGPSFTWFGVTNGLLIHVVGVGLPAALAARWAAPTDRVPLRATR
jgi:hypothetical protein